MSNQVSLRDTVTYTKTSEEPRGRIRSQSWPHSVTPLVIEKEKRSQSEERYNKSVKEHTTNQKGTTKEVKAPGNGVKVPGFWERHPHGRRGMLALAVVVLILSIATIAICGGMLGSDSFNNWVMNTALPNIKQFFAHNIHGAQALLYIGVPSVVGTIIVVGMTILLYRHFDAKDKKEEALRRTPLPANDPLDGEGIEDLNPFANNKGHVVQGRIKTRNNESEVPDFLGNSNPTAAGVFVGDDESWSEGEEWNASSSNEDMNPFASTKGQSTVKVIPVSSDTDFGDD